MGRWWARSGRLALDDEGGLWLVSRGRDLYLGPVEDAPEVPADSDDDRDHLLDLWADAPAWRDARAEGDHAYYGGLLR